MLEPYEGKLSRTVLRGEGGSNTPDLPDYCNLRCDAATGTGPVLKTGDPL